MVERELTDGKRIAQLLASELEGHEASLGALSVVDADPDVEPTDSGAFAYGVERAGNRIAAVYVHPEHARVEFESEQETTEATAESVGLAVHTADSTTVIELDNGATVKRVVRVFEAAFA